MAARTRKSTCALPAKNSNRSPSAVSAVTTGPGLSRRGDFGQALGAPPQPPSDVLSGSEGSRRKREDLWSGGRPRGRLLSGWLWLRGRLWARDTLSVLRCPQASRARSSRAGPGPCTPCAGRVPWPPDPWTLLRGQTATAPGWSKEEESAASGGHQSAAAAFPRRPSDEGRSSQAQWASPAQVGGPLELMLVAKAAASQGHFERAAARADPTRRESRHSAPRPCCTPRRYRRP